MHALRSAVSISVLTLLLANRRGCADADFFLLSHSALENVTTGAGSSIITLGRNKNGVASYCCGIPVSDGHSVVCPDGHSFFVKSGTILAGYAALTNVSSLAADPTSSGTPEPTGSNTASSSTAGSSNHDVAIGVGVGVPLGVIAVLTTLWALWERRKRLQYAQAVLGSGTAMTTDKNTSPQLGKESAADNLPELMATSQMHELQS